MKAQLLYKIGYSPCAQNELEDDLFDPRDYDMALKLIPPTLWAKNKKGVGQLTVTQVKITLKSGKLSVKIKQCPLSKAYTEAITAQVQHYISIGKRRSPWNTPLFPVKKKVTPGVLQGT